MKIESYFLPAPSIKFSIKPERKGYWKVVNNYDKSTEALCITKEEAIEMCDELNSLRVTH